MGKAVLRHSRLNRVLLAAAVAVLAGVPRPANAQLRSLHAVQYMALEPPTAEAADLHKQLSAWLRRFAVRLVEPGVTFAEEEPKWSWSEPGGRYRFARCTLRTDFPQPQRIGLECSDYAGHYVGTLRFSVEAELQRWVDELAFNQPVARPLSTVRYIVVGPMNGDSDNIVPYVRQLLRADGTFNILDSDDDLSDEAKEDLVRCEITPYAGSSGDWRNGRSFSRLRLKDPFGRTVRVFEGASPRARAIFANSSSLRGRMHDAVQKLLAARRQDEQTYRARASAPN